MMAKSSNKTLNLQKDVDMNYYVINTEKDYHRSYCSLTKFLMMIDPVLIDLLILGAFINEIITITKNIIIRQPVD